MADQIIPPIEIVGGPGGRAFALKPSTCVLAKSLAANTAEAFVVPTNAKYVLFSAAGDFYANYTTTATVPGDTVLADAPASELNPGMRYIPAGCTSISIISPSAIVVTASFYRD